MLHHWPSKLLLLLLSGGSLGVANGQVYGPLDCNANIDCTVSTPLSTLVNGAGGLDRVIVPCGQCAHVDYTAGETISLPLGLEVVGSLLFPPSSNVVLNTTAVIVQGNLDIEPPAEGNEVKVILHGSEEQYLYPHDECNGGYDPSCSAKASVGKKPIVVAGGKVNIRGMDAAIDCPSWTRLDRKVSDTNLKIDPSFAACVKPGDDLLVTSDNTNWQDEMKRQVTAVNSTTGEITLDSAITRALPALTGPGEPEYAVEVARLSRSVVFTAVEDDPEGEHIGGHFMVFVTPDVVQVISGVHFDNFGQGGNLGRYPVHFHLCDNSNGSIVSKNVITNSNQRCVLIHGTNGVTVEDNVAWNTRGHCYATETGTEVNNIFKNNLGSHTMKLWFHNTQSDSLNFWTGKHTAATFWVRNMNNEWIGNVAAGSESLGWWIEMRELNGDQKTLEPISSFRDNVAHSNKVVGFGTYKQGWKPTNGGVLDNLHIYKNPDIGFKYHITGNIRVTNSLFADNGHHILSGVWNSPVTFENSVFDSMSQDRQLRQEITCPVATYKTAIKHAYNNDIASPLTFINATFANLKCGKNMFQFHNDNRGGGRSMGAPTRASGITLINVDENRKPHFNCDFGARDTFLEDVDGVLGPSSSTGSPGFIVRNVAWMLAFIPPESCSNIPYSGSDCSVYCEGTCLRQVSIQPSFGGQASTTLDLRLFDGVTEKVYQSQGFADFRIVLPQGSYHGSFFDETGTEVIASSVEVTPYQEPLCNDFVTANDFIFTTNEPTPAPSHGPTISPAPTFPADSVVRIKSIVNNRYLWVRPDGGLKASSDMAPLANTAIVLIKKECLSEGYHFDKGLTSPCYLIQWEHGRRLGAKSGQVWLKGVYATRNEVVNDNYWFLDPIDCEVTGLEGNSCTLLINAFNGRAMYDHDTFMDMGASPEVAQGGDLDSLVYSKKLYRWTLIDANA